MRGQQIVASCRRNRGCLFFQVLALYGLNSRAYLFHILIWFLLKKGAPPLLLLPLNVIAPGRLKNPDNYQCFGIHQYKLQILYPPF